jgi:predicted site-specific integrase-resolvase
MGPLLDLSTTATLLNTSPTTVARWAKDGSLPSVVLHQGKRKPPGASGAQISNGS